MLNRCFRPVRWRVTGMGRTASGAVRDVIELVLVLMASHRYLNVAISGFLQSSVLSVFNAA